MQAHHTDVRLDVVAQALCVFRVAPDVFPGRGICNGYSLFRDGIGIKNRAEGQEDPWIGFGPMCKYLKAPPQYNDGGGVYVPDHSHCDSLLYRMSRCFIFRAGQDQWNVPRILLDLDPGGGIGALGERPAVWILCPDRIPPKVVLDHGRWI